MNVASLSVSADMYDGTDVYTLYDMDGSLDRENWSTEVKGKTLRYRNNFRCRHCGAWAIPGGFIGMQESLEESAKRKLKEETGLEGIEIKQLYTFGAVDRDPRTRVISVAYFALLPKTLLRVQAGRGADRAVWAEVLLPENSGADGLTVGDGMQLAFDHREIITTAIQRLRGKLSYTDIAFGLLPDKNRFAIYELQKIYESILQQKQDTANFRRMFLTTYVARGLAEATGEDCVEYSRRASKYYRLVPPAENK